MAACGVSSSLVSSVLSTRTLAAGSASRATSAACTVFLPAHKSGQNNVRYVAPLRKQSEAIRSKFLGSSAFGTRQGSFYGAGVATRAIHGTARTTMTIAVGDELPDAQLSYFDSENNMQVVSAKEFVKGKKVVLFAVPGAFTPTCSLKHLPSFIDSADKLKAKGIDEIACIAVNDAFVMQAWGKSVGAEGKVLLLADGSGQFAKALGVELDLVDKGLGIRSRRYSMLVNDGKVAALNLEEGGAFSSSGAEDILKAL